MKNVGVTILIFGAMVGVGLFIWNQHKKGIEEDIKNNWG
jgi:hypothetical protein